MLAARSAVAARPIAEMEALTGRIASSPGIFRAAFGFTEMGSPTLRDALLGLVAAGSGEVVIVPLMLPMEPSFEVWLAKAVGRWSKGAEGFPPVKLAPPPALAGSFDELMRWLVAAGVASEAIVQPSKPPSQSCVVPAMARRVLVCMGGPCNNLGAPAVWAHFRREVDRLGLRSAGGGANSCKTSCLGPCELGPVVQVYPEGTFYGGIDEAGFDAIIARHILGGEVVAELAYTADGKKKTLRKKAEMDPTNSV